ncbi:MAG: gamma-glutamylcyclotransferase family protein [Planctomycetota bacterium]
MLTGDYFAYGSNLSSRRLRARTPSARPVRVAALEGWSLRWHKRSLDGSGKCDIVPEEGGTVWGVVYAIDLREKPRLDAAEGLGHGYEERRVEHGWTYVATDVDPSRMPYDWYKAFVVAGAREHGLPDAYVRGLEAVPARMDEDRERARRQALILEDR